MSDEIYYSTRKEVQFIRGIGLYTEKGRLLKELKPTAWKKYKQVLLGNYLRNHDRDWDNLDAKICLKVTTEELKKIDGEGN